MPETDYLKVPADRVGVLIGTKGETKKKIENATQTQLDIDSEEGTVAIYPNKDMEDPLGVWKANNIVKAIARGFNPYIALKLNQDDIYLIIVDMAEVDIAIYGKTVSLIGELENVMVAREAVEMILKGSRHKSVYSFLENKKNERKMKEFKAVVGIDDDKIELRDDLDDVDDEE